MSLVSVLECAIAQRGIGARPRLLWWSQNNYALITGGMPVFSFWGTGVITYELTMLGAVLAPPSAIFCGRAASSASETKLRLVPTVQPECICLRVRSASDDVTKPTALLRAAGATSVEKKAAL